MQKTFNNVSPIFIVGAARSGTTLLQMMINAHPELAVYGEIHYFDLILQIKNKIPCLESPEQLDRFSELVRKTQSFKYLPDAEQILLAAINKMNQEKAHSYEEFYLHFMREYSVNQKKSRFGEKTPENVRYINEIINIFPNARVIHIVRDPRAVVASMLKVSWASNDVLTNALKWRSDVSSASDRINDHDHYIQLRYEDLVEAPEIELKKICDFISEKYDAAMLDYHKDSTEHIKNEPWKKGVHNPVNNKSNIKWGNELTTSQVMLIENITGYLMDIYNYKRTRHSIYDRFLYPYVVSASLFNYFVYKVKQYRELRRNSDEIVGKSNKLLSKLIHSIKNRD